METLARHLLVELKGCSGRELAEESYLIKTLDATAQGLGATVRYRHVERTGAQSLTGLVIADHAHVVVRTWADHHYAAADIVTDSVMPLSRGLERLIDAFCPSAHLTFEVGRGPCEARPAAPGPA